MEIIAEFGCNFDISRDLNDVSTGIAWCRDLGIKYAKFQLWKKDQVPKEVYKYHIDEEDAYAIFETGMLNDVEVFFTPFYPEAVDICERIGVKYYKIRYADYFNTCLYRKIYTTDKKFFVSSDSIPIGHRNVKNLYCVPKYPAKLHDYPMNLPEGYDGYSDHTPNLTLYKHACSPHHVGRSPRWFEMHVCLDDNAYERKWSKTFDEIGEALGEDILEDNPYFKNAGRT